MTKTITRGKIARDIVQAFKNDSNLLPSIARRTSPDDTVMGISPDDFASVVERGEYNDDMAYRILYTSYWLTTTITSALMCSPDVLGQSYLPEAQLKRMSQRIYDNYITILKLNGRVKTNTP